MWQLTARLKTSRPGIQPGRGSAQIPLLPSAGQRDYRSKGSFSLGKPSKTMESSCKPSTANPQSKQTVPSATGNSDTAQGSSLSTEGREKGQEEKLRGIEIPFHTYSSFSSCCWMSFADFAIVTSREKRTWNQLFGCLSASRTWFLLLKEGQVTLCSHWSHQDKDSRACSRMRDAGALGSQA